MVFKNNLKFTGINFVLACEDFSPRYGNDKKKVFFSTVVNWGRFMNNLVVNK